MTDEDKSNDNLTDNLLSDLANAPQSSGESLGDLVVEPEEDNLKDSFARELEKNLKETEEQVLDLVESDGGIDPVTSWQTARNTVEAFEPIPWFIWRLSNYVLGKPGKIGEATEGLVFGLRRLLFATASDPVLGVGEKVNNVRKALKIIPSDVVAAVAIVYAVSKRLSKSSFERIWRPILDDALLRAHIGYLIGSNKPEFGGGRGMLAGFVNRAGLVIQISSGELDKAKRALEQLATGEAVREIGLSLYKSEPIQIGAMLMSAAGCGRDCSYGITSFSASDPLKAVQNEEQKRWLAAFSITEHIRMAKPGKIQEELWDAMGYEDPNDRVQLSKDVKTVVRRGHGWSWLCG